MKDSKLKEENTELLTNRDDLIETLNNSENDVDHYKAWILEMEQDIFKLRQTVAGLTIRLRDAEKVIDEYANENNWGEYQLHDSDEVYLIKWDSPDLKNASSGCDLAKFYRSKYPKKEGE